MPIHGNTLEIFACFGNHLLGESTQPWPVLWRLWFCPPNLCPGKAFACSPKYLKYFYVPNLILGRGWQCLKLQLSSSLSDSKVLFLYLPKNLRIFLLQNLIYCITFLLYCSSSSKNLFLYSCSDDLLCLYLSVWHLEAQCLEKAGKETCSPRTDTNQVGTGATQPCRVSSLLNCFSNAGSLVL